MLINKITIERFRGFNNVSFELGSSLTIIAGQNGTQKTTVLGLLSQPFSITDKNNPMQKEKPLCGGNYKSSFSEKFKLSKTFDKPKSHSWTLYTNDVNDSEFQLESIKRSKSKDDIRFWKKGDRSKGSGYLQYPVIYLSLSRLLPMGEDSAISESTSVSLTNDEILLYNEWHNKILIIPDLEIKSAAYLSSTQKNTVGVSTNYYDWRMNSSGQDNLGKILLAILSFKRLKEKYKNNYKGGILVIDEIDTTLYPASQIKLIEYLRKFSSKYSIQIIFTTHSLTILEKVSQLQNNPKLTNQIKVVYLQKLDDKIKIKENVDIDYIRNQLNVTLKGITIPIKIPTFTEDREAEIFLKGLLKRKGKSLKYIQCTMGCNNYVELVRKKVIGFNHPESLICLDGDVGKDKSMLTKIKKHKNFLILPGKDSPEKLLAEMLYNEKESSSIWEDDLHAGYCKQICFKDYSINDIRNNREKAKEWFKSQKQYWGIGCNKVINIWIKKNQEEVNDFKTSFDKIIATYK